MSAIEQVDWAAKSYLVVDDFVGVRRLLRDSLRNLGAKNIDQASSGGEAIALLARIRYDLVLCDYKLGEGKNGQQVLEAARLRNYLLPSSVWMMVSAEKSVESVIGARLTSKCCRSANTSGRALGWRAYLGLARVCGQKNDTKEALQLLLAVQRDFAGDELEELLDASAARPDTPTCLAMAALLLAVGVKEAAVELLCYVTRNNHDNSRLLDEVQKIFDQARMGEEGIALIRSSKKEASDQMNQGVLLWKTGKLADAVAWMRHARRLLPHNLRILFNAAQILLSHLQQIGYDEALAAEALDVLMDVDRIQPGQQRFAQLMEQLARLAPVAGPDRDPAD